MGNSDAKLLLIGLDNSGKTTILSRIIDPDVMDLHITPTIGYKKDVFSREGIDFEVLDMSGQSKYRDLWLSNATTQSERDQIHGIIFVVDASDRMRLKVAKDQLQLILKSSQVPKSIPFLFFANKSELKGACHGDEVEEILELKSIERNYQLFNCSGLSGKGVQQGINWLAGIVKVKMS